MLSRLSHASIMTYLDFESSVSYHYLVLEVGQIGGQIGAILLSIQGV